MQEAKGLLTSGIPTHGYPRDKLGVFLAIVKCNENETHAKNKEHRYQHKQTSVVKLSNSKAWSFLMIYIIQTSKNILSQKTTLMSL